MIYDAVVVGAGVEGSGVAYQLARAGLTTLLLEQFHLPHTRGSSHGQSRICRKAYPEDFIAALMSDAYKEWEELERKTDTKFFDRDIGLVYLSEPETVKKVIEPSMIRNGHPYTVLKGSEVTKRYPGMVYDDSLMAVYDASAGVLRADKAVDALQKAFKMHGGELKDGVKVEFVRPGKDVTTILTDTGSYRARHVVIAAGPWTQKLTRPLGLEIPLQIERVPVFYWRLKDPQQNAKNGIPIFIDEGTYPGHIYGLPALEYKDHAKVLLHGGIPVSDADARDLDTPPPRKHIEDTAAYVRDHFPFLEDRPSIIETCMYTVTPDSRYIIDRHPLHSNIFLAIGFSGHGFKVAPTVGNIIKDWIIKGKTSFDVAPFSITRFKDVVKSRL